MVERRAVAAWSHSRYLPVSLHEVDLRHTYRICEVLINQWRGGDRARNLAVSSYRPPVEPDGLIDDRIL